MAKFLLLILIFFVSNINVLAQNRNIVLDSPDLIVSIPVRGGFQEIVAYKDKGNDSALQVKNAGAFRWFSSGFPQPVRLPGLKYPYEIDGTDNELILYVRLLNDTYKEKLAESATRKYGKEVMGKFTKENIYLVEFQFFEASISFESSKGERIFKGSAQNIGQTVLQVLFKVKNKDDLHLLAKKIKEGVRVNYRFAFQAQKVKVNKLSISADDLKDLELLNSLKGAGNKTYISRYQLTKLAGAIYTELDIREEYDIDEEKFSEEFVQALIKQILMTEYEKVNFKKALENLSSYFYPSVLKDLGPNEIQKEMSKIFEVNETDKRKHIVLNRKIWDEGKKRFKTTTEHHFNASVLEKIFNGNTDIKFVSEKEEEWKNNKDSLDDQLNELNEKSQSEVEWTFEGNQIIPKSLNVASLANANISRRLRISRIRNRFTNSEEQIKKSFHTRRDLAISKDPDTETRIFKEISQLKGEIESAYGVFSKLQDKVKKAQNQTNEAYNLANSAKQDAANAYNRANNATNLANLAKQNATNAYNHANNATNLVNKTNKAVANAYSRADQVYNSLRGLIFSEGHYEIKTTNSYYSLTRNSNFANVPDAKKGAYLGTNGTLKVGLFFDGQVVRGFSTAQKEIWSIKRVK